MRGKSVSLRELEALYEHAVCAAQEERTDEAIRRFNSLLRMTARRKSAGPDTRGRSATRQRRRGFRSHRSLVAACLVNLATCHAEKGNFAEAIDQLRAALKLEPRNREAACQLGHTYERTGESAKAMQQFRDVLRVAPECAEAHAGLSRCHLHGGEYARAIQACRAALELSPDCAAARVDLAIALKRCGCVDEAIEAAEGLSDELPHDPAPVHELAELWMSADRPAEAIRTLEPMLAEGQHHEPAVTTLAEAYLALGEHRRAIEACKRSRAAGADRVPVLDLMVMAYEHVGDIPNALVTVTELVQATPLDAHAHFRMGTILQRSGDFSNAMARYAMAAELSPESDQVREAAEEAIETLDAIQLQQIVALASANVVFRAKLDRDMEGTLRDYGFRITDAAMGMLGSLDMDDLAPVAGHVDRRMSH
ncbi:MAG: tetratricopeptide repeat protein [Armatimonadota bacterium]